MLLEELTRIRKHAHRAILILSPEFKTEIRGSEHAIPNLNVLFEFGFFYGSSVKPVSQLFVTVKFTCRLILAGERQQALYSPRRSRGR